MLRLRRSLLAIFSAFLFFDLGWLAFFRLNDPLPEWNALVSRHPEIVLPYNVLRFAGGGAFMLLVIGGLPVILSALKRAFLERRRDVLILAGGATLALLIFCCAAVLVLLGVWPRSIDSNGWLYGLLFLILLVVGSLAVFRAVLRSGPSERVLRLARIPAVLVTLGMGVTLVATLFEAHFLSQADPGSFVGAGAFNWIVAIALMFLSTGVASVALWWSFKKRPATLPARS